MFLASSGTPTDDPKFSGRLFNTSKNKFKSI